VPPFFGGRRTLYFTSEGGAFFGGKTLHALLFYRVPCLLPCEVGRNRQTAVVPIKAVLQGIDIRKPTKYIFEILCAKHGGRYISYIPSNTLYGKRSKEDGYNVSKV
jgi:hypothetical protein